MSLMEMLRARSNAPRCSKWVTSHWREVTARFRQKITRYVGVDGGCLKLLEQGLPLDVAVGDFDSVSETDLRKTKPKPSRLLNPS